MKEKKNYYLIVPVNDIYEKTKKEKVLMIDNYNPKEIFDKYQIPNKYQKIVLKLAFKNDFNLAKELLTDAIYILEIPFIKVLLCSNESKTIRMESIDNIIETKCSFYSINKVKEFYQELIDNKIIYNYELAINELFRYNKKKKDNVKLRKIKRNEYIH